MDNQPQQPLPNNPQDGNGDYSPNLQPNLPQPPETTPTKPTLVKKTFSTFINAGSKLKSPGKGLKLFITLLIVSGIAGLSFYIASLTHCQGVGLGGLECTGGPGLGGSLILIAVGSLVPLILAPILLKVFAVPHPIIKGLLLGLIPVVVAGTGTWAWNQHTANRDNANALKDLTSSTKQIGFTFYLPSYISPGFYQNTFLPNTGVSPSSASIAYNKTSDPGVGFQIDESKSTPTDSATIGCDSYKTTYSSYGTCDVLQKNNSGDNIYITKRLDGIGTTYSLDHQGIKIVLINDHNSPEPQDELIKMLNSLQPQSEQQLEKLLKQ